MKRGKLWLLPIVLFVVGLAIGYASPGYAAHPGGPVTLKDAAGNPLSAGVSTTPYSPKRTCGGCHNYESDPATITKDHGPGTTQYTVRAPQHGVSTGYHFQQGRNIAWTSANNNAQRSFYALPKFTSSPGMYGKY